MNKDNNFENNLKKLESIVEKLENGEVDLEESVKLYEEGMNLKKACLSAVTKQSEKSQFISN